LRRIANTRDKSASSGIEEIDIFRCFNFEF